MKCVFCEREVEDGKICCTRNVPFGAIKLWDVIIYTVLITIPLVFLIYKLDTGYIKDNMIYVGATSYTIMYIVSILYKVFTRSEVDYIAFAFYCHQKVSRSFKFHQRLIPICSRCFGILVGHVIITCVSLNIESIALTICFAIPLIVDGTLQLLTKYNSKNPIRFISGLLFSVPMAYLFATLILMFSYVLT